MGLWFFHLIILLLIPATMIGFGLLWKKHPPKDINAVYGYRTSRSCKSQETWDFAHQAIGRLWRRWGLVLLAALPAFLLAALARQGWNPACFLDEPADADAWLLLVLVGVQLAVIIGSIFPVERALKTHFDSFGRPR